VEMSSLESKYKASYIEVSISRCPSGDVSWIFLVAICRWSKPSHLVKVNHSGEVDRFPSSVARVHVEVLTVSGARVLFEHFVNNVLSVGTLKNHSIR
jgi:hypothetical protein